MGQDKNSRLAEIDDNFTKAIELYPVGGDANVTLSYWKERIKYYYTLSNTSLDKFLGLEHYPVVQ